MTNIQTNGPRSFAPAQASSAIDPYHLAEARPIGNSEEGTGGTRSESLLIRRVLAGETDLFSELVEPDLTRRLRNFASRALGNSADAEDVLQEALLKAFCHLAEFRHESSFTTWLSCILRNEIVGAIRARFRKREVWADNDLAADWHIAAPLWPNREASPLDGVEQKESSQRMHRFLKRLPTGLRAVVLLRDIKEFSTIETAVHLRLTPETVKTRLFRARRRLAKMYSAQERCRPASIHLGHPQGPRFGTPQACKRREGSLQRVLILSEYIN